MDSNTLKEKGRLTRNLRRIGHTLIEGPRALHPPEHIDRHGWLEPDLTLIWGRHFRRHESIIVFCDSTVNRDSDFLPPMLRYIRWDLRQDLPTLPAWPSVEVQLSYVAPHQERVSDQIRRIEHALTQAPFIPTGLIAERHVPQLDEVNTDDARGDIEIQRSNGLHFMTWSGPALPPGDPLTNTFFAVFAELRTLITPIARLGWTETYNRDPTVQPVPPGESWDRNGHIPTQNSELRTQN